MTLLRRVLDAVQRDPATAEVVVVDDGAGGAVRRLFAAGGGAAPLHVLEGGGAGPSAARQAGVEAARGEVVVLLDDDVVPRPGLVGRHLRLLRGDRTAVTVGYSPVSLPARRGAGDVATFAYARDYERRCAHYASADAPVLHNLWGGNVGLWREAALDVGLSAPPFDGPRAFHEDRDFGLRALRAGLHGVFDRSLAADHHHRRTAAAALADAERRGEGLVRLHRRHADLIGPWDGTTRLAALADAAVPVALAGIALAGRARRWTVQDAGFKLARRICEQQGALRAAAEPAP